LWKITLPLIAPGLLSGTLLVFVTALGEFVSSILLAGEAQPVSVHIYGLLRVRYELAAAYSALLMGLILITLAASSKLFKTGGVRI
jgi:ABC-type spermidine/putrescine transport system permease subunit II